MRVHAFPFTATMLALSAACSSGHTLLAPGDSSASLNAPSVLSVTPANALVGVDRVKPITISFSRSMMTGMEMLVVVHEGSVLGPQVAGVSSWSVDHATMTFTPSSPLKSKTTYVIHMSPSLQGTNGMMINLSSGTQLGAHMVSGNMMGTSSTGGMMSGGTWGAGMMGAGWQAADGTFGMMFTFTTA